MPVVGGVQRAQLGHPLDGPQRAQLGEGEVLGEPAGADRPSTSLVVRRSANSGRRGDVGGERQLALVPDDEDAVAADDEVGLDQLGAEVDGELVAGGRVLRPVGRGAAVADDHGLGKAGRWPTASDAVARMSLTTHESDGGALTEANVSRDNSEDTTLTCAATMLAVTDLSALGWTPDRARRPARPAAPPARVSRVDRGRLTRADGRRRAPACTPAPALYDERGPVRPGGGGLGRAARRAGGRRPAPDAAPSSARSPAGRRRRRWSPPTSTSSSWSMRCPATRGCAGWSATSRSPGAAGRRRSSCSPRPTSATTSRPRSSRCARTRWASTSCAVSSRRPARGWTPSARCSAPGRTGAMVGPSGVGKSSLVNALAGGAIAEHRGIRDERRPRPAHHDGARAAPAARRRAPGRHPGHARARRSTTTPRASTPRTPTSRCSRPTAGSATARHRTEPGCAVAAAIDDGRLDPAALQRAGASCRPRRTASCSGWTPARGRRRRRGCGPSTGRSGSSRTGTRLDRPAR